MEMLLILYNDKCDGPFSKSKWALTIMPQIPIMSWRLHSVRWGAWLE